MNYSDEKILTIERNYHKGLFLEMTFISQEPNTINENSNIKNISEIYFFLLSVDIQQNNQFIPIVVVFVVLECVPTVNKNENLLLEKT